MNRSDRTDWPSRYILTISLVVGLAAGLLWHGPSLAQEATLPPTYCIISEMPIKSYDEDERDKKVVMALKQFLANEAAAGRKINTKHPLYQEALKHPALYVEHYGYMTRAKLDPKTKTANRSAPKSSAPSAKSASEVEADLIENDLRSDLFLHIRWNVRAVERLLKEITANSSSSVATVAANKIASSNAAKITKVEDKKHPTVLAWINCDDERGRRRLVLDNLNDDEEITLVEFLRRGAKRKGIKLLFPVLNNSERVKASSIDWTNAKKRQALLQVTGRYATDLVLTGNIKKRAVKQMWYGQWCFWNGRRWIGYRTSSRNRSDVIAAMWSWLAKLKVAELAALDEKVEREEEGPLLVELRISQVYDMECGREVLEYLRNLSSLISGLEIYNLRSNGIDVSFTFSGTEKQLRSLLRGSQGVVLLTYPSKKKSDKEDRKPDSSFETSGEAEDKLQLDCKWIRS